MTSARTRSEKVCVILKRASRGHPRLTPDGNDELGNDGKDLVASVVQQVLSSLTGQERVRMSRLR